MNLRPSSDAWDLEGIEGLVEHPSIRLFRSPNAAMILTFLHRAFKEHEDIAIPESRLRARLDNYLEEIRDTRPDAFPRTAAEYLADWCSGDQLLLRKLYSDAADEPTFELTAASERALLWLEDLQARPFVAAESRLELIVRQLEEILLFSTPDADRRIAALEAQQLALQVQVDTIRSARKAETFSSVQLTERFANVLDLARTLAADFRQLEDNFKEVARSLADAQADPDSTKGKMVGHLLDTHSALRQLTTGSELLLILAIPGCSRTPGALAHPYATGLPARCNRSGLCAPIGFLRPFRPGSLSRVSASSARTSEWLPHFGER